MSNNGAGITSFQDYQNKLLQRRVPLHVMIEITYLCNLRCRFCYNPTHEAIGEMSTKDILFCFDELAKIGVPKIVLTGGECMAHRDFFPLLDEAHKRQFSVEVFTNATLIDEATAARLREYPISQISTSIHGDNATTHDAQTLVPGSFDKLLRALDLLQDAPFKRELKCVITRACQEQLRGIKAIGDRYGCHTRFTMQITPRDNGDTSPLEEAVTDDFRRRFYSAEFDGIREEAYDEERTYFNEGDPICGTGLMQFAIDPYGNVFPCVAWRQSAGNILRDGIEKIWFGDNPTLRKARDVAKRMPTEGFAEEERGFAQFCAGHSHRMTGNPMHVFEEERMEIQLRREAHLRRLGNGVGRTAAK